MVLNKLNRFAIDYISFRNSENGIFYRANQIHSNCSLKIHLNCFFFCFSSFLFLLPVKKKNKLKNYYNYNYNYSFSLIGKYIFNTNSLVESILENCENFSIKITKMVN